MKHFYLKITKKTFTNLFLAITFLLGTQAIQAATITSAQSGDWTDPLTWVGGVIPANSSTTDYVIIASGHAVTFPLTVNHNIGGLNIQSSASLTVSNNFTFGIGNVSPFSNIAGNLTITGTSSRSFGTLTVASTGVISSTTGATSISSTTGVTWVNNGTVTLTTLGLTTGRTIENNGTFSCGMGSTSAGTFNNNFGATLNLTGTVAGNINNFGTMNSAGLSGTAVTAVINNKATGVLDFTGSSMSATNLILDASEAGNTVIYSLATSQTVKIPSTTYSNLTFSGGSTKTIPTAASTTLCTGTLTISGASTRASITNTNVGVAMLNYNNSIKADGTYGSQNVATVATTKDNTYFASAASGNLTVNASLSTAKFAANEVKLYPNPAVGGKFTISLPSLEDASIVSISNIAGQTVYATTIAANNDLAINPDTTLATGIYFVKIEQAGKTLTKKLIVK